MINNNEVSMFELNKTKYRYYRIDTLGEVTRLPFSIRVLLENILRNQDGSRITRDHLDALLNWPRGVGDIEIPFMPARIVLQDFTGVPAVVDLAAMRAALQRMGTDPRTLNPVIPVDLVVDHSVQVDFFGTNEAFRMNVEREYERNRERYSILKWATEHLDGFRVVPPGTGIVHQVNLEYLSEVVRTSGTASEVTAYPDTLLGTDSHTTMINALSVLGWGVGGIEAEAVMLGQPYSMLLPEVVGFRLVGELPEGATATDLVLTVTQVLRKNGVVGKFVEFTGPGLAQLSLPDRATISNMAPEYGATTGFFPVDAETLDYLKLTGRENLIPLVEKYTRLQHLFRTDESPEPEFNETITLELQDVLPCLAGPGRPQDRIPLTEVRSSFRKDLPALVKKGGSQVKVHGKERVNIVVEGVGSEIGHGSIVIAAITSCTNTSNPSVLVGAGLLAKKAIDRGLSVMPHVKTSLAPGSRVVTNYLEKAGLLSYLESLRFNVVGYGCTTCIGNSGPLPEPVARAIDENDLVVAAVLSGNRNFEARIHSQVRANYLASPILVVAYAIAGRIDIDFETEPIGHDRAGKEVYLRDVWPSQSEITSAVSASISPSMFRERYSEVFEGDECWRGLEMPEGDLYQWNPDSTYILEPPFFVDMPAKPEPLEDITGARVLALLGDSVTTDHISPAGAIPPDGPTGRYLLEKGIPISDFNTYGSRRGNHEVMVRGAFANIRLRNLLLEGVEGGVTIYFPTEERMTIYDAAIRYRSDSIPLVVIAGSEYGSGSSRDWAAKGTRLLGVRAVIAESYERIHRSNLYGVGVLPLQFAEGQNRKKLGITGSEVFTIRGIASGLRPRKLIEVTARSMSGKDIRFKVIARLDSEFELECYKNGGMLPLVLRSLSKRR